MQNGWFIAMGAATTLVENKRKVSPMDAKPVADNHKLKDMIDIAIAENNEISLNEIFK